MVTCDGFNVFATGHVWLGFSELLLQSREQATFALVISFFISCIRFSIAEARKLQFVIAGQSDINMSIV